MTERFALRFAWRFAQARLVHQRRLMPPRRSGLAGASCGDARPRSPHFLGKAGIGLHSLCNRALRFRPVAELERLRAQTNNRRRRSARGVSEYCEVKRGESRTPGMGAATRERHKRVREFVCSTTSPQARQNTNIWPSNTLQRRVSGFCRSSTSYTRMPSQWKHLNSSGMSCSLCGGHLPPGILGLRASGFLIVGSTVGMSCAYFGPAL